ncbi:hypothetical protein R5R35_009898 [Gryllus longicercus]|uniref:Uncharacterized protein n=1 Tax=Gryllus longicercus TaxID=2509291 RepID=A0AAN9ZDV3_9ORTH
MVSTLWIFSVLYVATYAMQQCPLFADSWTWFGLCALGVLVVIMLFERLQLIAPSFSPRTKYKNSAVLVVGADQSVGWQLITRCVTRDMLVFAGVQDTESPQADWIRRHLHRDVVLVRLDPRSEDDVRAAVRLVEDTIGEKELVGIVYAGYAAPKLAETLDLEEVRRGIEMSALGAVRTAEAFTPLLKKYKGRFIMVADMAGQIVIPSLQSYCMSQAVTLQFVKIIRNNLKKHGVSTHIIQPFLYYYQKTQEDYYYPYTTEDGKVVVESNVDGTDFTAFRIMMSIFDALMSKNPKEYFIPTYPELLLHTLINFFPPCLYNRLADHLFMNLTKQKEIHDNRKDKSALLSASTVK